MKLTVSLRQPVFELDLVLESIPNETDSIILKDARSLRPLIQLHPDGTVVLFTGSNLQQCGFRVVHFSGGESRDVKLNVPTNLA